AQVVIGPEQPVRDELDRALLGEEARLPRRVGLMRAGSLDDLDGLARDLEATAGGGEPDWSIEDQDGAGSIDLSLFEDPDTGAVRAAFAGNPSARPLRALLRAPAGVALSDVRSGRALAVEEGGAALDLEPWAVRFLAVS
ncbi:MAG TPA: hypothetical protein VNO33_05650, partial [Kofleriaceae bacterium]|nr:hypothetical protein [Kofleriaceae bacterium]